MDFFNTYLGNWTGIGESFGQKLSGKLRIHTRCEGDFLVFEETLFDTNSSCIYEDCAWISKQTGIERPQYIGYHFTPGGNVQRFLLVKKEGVHGFHWWAGPLVPVAYYKMHEENLVITVLDIQEVIVHQMTYRRT